jgi:hypothetical protein
MESDIFLITNLTDESDWNILIIESHSLSAQWDTIAGFLGLKPSKIAEIKRDNPTNSTGCWNSALLEWISENYNTDKFCRPSWRTFLKAVALVNKSQLKKLAADHPGIPLLIQV